MRKLTVLFACLLPAAFLYAAGAPAAASSAGPKTFDVHSPNGALEVHVSTGPHLTWSVKQHDQPILETSPIALQLSNGEILGDNIKIQSSSVQSHSGDFTPLNYKKSVIHDQYTLLTINCKGDYSLLFRVYDDAVAYRFVTRKKDTIEIKNESANFNFSEDEKALVPIQWDYRDGKNFNSSFETLYEEMNLSQFPKDSLAFLPLLVNIGQDRKVVILEADLENYPGMYLNLNETQKGLKGVYAPYPLGGYMKSINYIADHRADYIAKVPGTGNLPWRVIVVSQQDKDLLDQDIVQKLAAPSQLTDASWIQTGQVAWDWWNDWNITHVNFKAGINTPTYKYYIDFAAENHLKYIILDEGWSDDFDLLKVKKDVHLQEIIDYGKQKGIGVILWATWHSITRQMDQVFPHYAQMGVKGFKIDFIDRDDQIAIASTYAIAKLAAQNHLLVDYHGTSKPSGLQRTWPNVIGYEGVKGLENFKWGSNEDQPRYVATIPYIRMMAGPMDYTPGAMRNATRDAWHPSELNPSSLGTRCQQLAEYVIFDAPLQMLSDNPTIYRKEQESTDFITKIPTTFDQTVALDGKVGQYVALAHRKGDTWYVGAVTNWTPRSLTLDFSFLPAGDYQVDLFQDGINADRDATDYEHKIIRIHSGDKLPIQLFGGGGWAARIWPAK